MPAMVDQRARELSLIAGRRPNGRGASDLRAAKRELLGDESADNAVDEPDIPPSGMGAPPTSHGRRVEPQLPKDDRYEEEMAQEGVDDAQHDQMLEASKHPTKNEE